MPLTVTRLTRWKRIDAFERDTAGAANQSVLKSDIAATASEEVKDSTEKKHAVIPNQVTEEVTVELKKKLSSSLIES
jgi:predicted nucleic acid-binding protein